MTSPRLPRTLLILVFGLLAVGFISRTAPLLDVDGRVLRQFPTEDGYLMLTIARNVALGHGMSTADGTLPTNGTQPLFNLIEAIGFYLASGHKQAGVTAALAWEVVFSVLAALGLFRMLRQGCKRRPHPERAAALAASAWFASPMVVPHSMNCLETGLYAALIVQSTQRWHRLWIGRAADAPHLRDALIVGLWLGITTWARIDAVFLIGAITATHTLLSLRDGTNTVRPRLLESVVMGVTAVVVISPWLIHNRLNFGSFMPISGTAQSHGSHLGSNFAEVPSKLFEYANVVLPIPFVLEKNTVFLALSGLVVAVYLLLLARSFRGLDTDERALFCVGTGMASMLVLYYGFTFGAPHFVGRYLFPVSPFAAAFTACLLVTGYDAWADRPLVRRGALAAGAVALLLIAGLQIRFYRNGTKHPHFQVVAWVQGHVPDTAWVGAEQTGTLGFFHDRTVNLDGKVNPEALTHVLADTIPSYIVSGVFGPERGHINYIADWAEIANWVKFEPMPAHFEVVVRDKAHNLGVLQRKAR